MERPILGIECRNRGLKSLVNNSSRRMRTRYSDSKHRHGVFNKSAAHNTYFGSSNRYVPRNSHIKKCTPASVGTFVKDTGGRNLFAYLFSANPPHCLWLTASLCTPVCQVVSSVQGSQLKLCMDFILHVSPVSS
jgi:hypothetical protein